MFEKIFAVFRKHRISAIYTFSRTPYTTRPIIPYHNVLSSFICVSKKNYMKSSTNTLSAHYQGGHFVLITAVYTSGKLSVLKLFWTRLTHDQKYCNHGDYVRIKLSALRALGLAFKTARNSFMQTHLETFAQMPYFTQFRLYSFWTNSIPYV